MRRGLRFRYDMYLARLLSHAKKTIFGCKYVNILFIFFPCKRAECSGIIVCLCLSFVLSDGKRAVADARRVSEGRSDVYLCLPPVLTHAEKVAKLPRFAESQAVDSFRGGFVERLFANRYAMKYQTFWPLG